MGITIGLDLGVSSVGWAVVNDNYEILESCSNIFPSADAAENAKRRGFRQGRRLTRRRRTRLSDFEKLWTSFGFGVPNNSLEDVLAYRIKGFSEKLSKNAIIYADSMLGVYKLNTS